MRSDSSCLLGTATSWPRDLPGPRIGGRITLIPARLPRRSALLCHRRAPSCRCPTLPPYSCSSSSPSPLPAKGAMRPPPPPTAASGRRATSRSWALLSMLVRFRLPPPDAGLLLHMACTRVDTCTHAVPSWPRRRAATVRQLQTSMGTTILPFNSARRQPI